jgi:hypothetical protein
MKNLTATTIFLSSLLLFLIEPIAAKQLLPYLGGSSAVWLTCLVFFQLVLLLGYLYAHQLARSGFKPKTREWPEDTYLYAIGISLLSAFTFVHPEVSVDPNHPIRSIFLTLGGSIGVPFLLLASTSPLLQVWIARSNFGVVPYRLFALSNIGSLLALFLYPSVIEPNFSLSNQRLFWFVGFLIYAGLLAQLTLRVRAANWNPSKSEVTTVVIALVSPTPEHPAPTLRARLLWFLLPMAAAMQLTAVTAHLTQNIAAIPLLWILPLAAYLLSFILAFQSPALYRRGIVIRLLVVMLASLGYALSRTDFDLPITLSILFFLVECLVACYFCHAETYALRPASDSDATLFYLLIAAGGATGTFLIAIASPILFSANYDLAISFFATAALALAVTWPYGWSMRLLWTAATAGLFALIVMLHLAYARDSLLQVRNFYGPLRVKQTLTPPLPNTPAEPIRTLLNGTIQHGSQIFSPTMSTIPTTYYAPDSGIGLALQLCCADQPRSIGVIGLGAGTIAAYGRPHDTIRFYELNPAVPPIARNLFTYLRDTPANVTIIEGDARTSLTRELAAPNQFDVLAIDAFSGDAIPLHLLTTQSIQLYLLHLKPNGILAFHVSNQYLDLAPEIALLADSAHLHSIRIESSAHPALGSFNATWVLVSADSDFFAQPRIAAVAHAIHPPPGLHAWTDNYSSLLPLLRR